MPTQAAGAAADAASSVRGSAALRSCGFAGDAYRHPHREYTARGWGAAGNAVFLPLSKGEEALLFPYRRSAHQGSSPVPQSRGIVRGGSCIFSFKAPFALLTGELMRRTLV